MDDGVEYDPDVAKICGIIGAMRKHHERTQQMHEAIKIECMNGKLNARQMAEKQKRAFVDRCIAPTFPEAIDGDLAKELDTDIDGSVWYPTVSWLSPAGFGLWFPREYHPRTSDDLTSSFMLAETASGGEKQWMSLPGQR